MRVSVALCTFNGEEYLAQQLDSIAQQTRRPDQVVILDDRSSDATVEIARSVCQKTGLRATIEVNEHRYGVDANFSCALGRTDGDVIFFCDQDDVWIPERIEKMLVPFEQSRSVMLVYSDGYITAADLTHTGATLFSHGGGKKKLAEGGRRQVGRWLQQGRNAGIKASAVAFRANVKEAAWPLPEGVEHDAWVAYFGYAMGRVVAIEEPLYLYRRHPRTYGASSTNRKVGEGRKETPANGYAKRIVQRAHLAECLHQRMETMQMGNSSTDAPAAADCNLSCDDVAQAARMLRRRARVVESSNRVIRIFRSLEAWFLGSYSAFTGYRERLDCLRKDYRAHMGSI